MSNRNRKKKSDNIDVKGELNNKKFKQNPNWYFKDAVQADVLSRIQMNAFGALSKIGENIQPTVCAMYANPCPGVSQFDTSGNDPIFNVNGDINANSKGINRAAQKLWYILTCKSGRAAGYTKADVALLLLGIGAMIETYEFIRRAFGIAYTYNQRNRALPTMLYKAMNVSMQDYQAHAADYLKRMNSLMAIMNQLPIPGNIAWFAKCQDLYQNIFMDYPSEMAQLFMISPATTWILEEDDGFVGGSYLRTVDMCIPHYDGVSSNSFVEGYTQSRAIYRAKCYTTDIAGFGMKTLNNYIDVFEEQVNKLLFSSTFSQIYSDILRAFDNGTLSRWSFDYIDEKYNVAPVFDDNRLWMIHNATYACGVLSLPAQDWQGKWTGSYTYQDVFKYGTPRNDVYQWANTDIVVYNPCLVTMRAADTGNDMYYGTSFDLVTDFPNDAPTTEERIEYTRYMFTGHNSSFDFSNPNHITNAYPISAFNFELPDHWFEIAFIFSGVNDPISIISDPEFGNADWLTDIAAGTPVNVDYQWSKFHHSKLIRGYRIDGINSYYQEGNVYGELNAWTKLTRNWFNSINDMVYVDLFDIR